MGKLLELTNERYHAATKNLNIKTFGSGRKLFITPVEISGSMTFDDTWRDFDCSSYVPANAEAVCLSIEISRTGNVLTPMELRQKGEANTLFWIWSNNIASSNYAANGVVDLPLDDSLIFQYKAPANSTTKNIIIYGYIT